MKAFLCQFGPLVAFSLSGFDRLRFCGESRLLNHPRGVQSYLYQQRLLFKDFPAHAEQLTKRFRADTLASLGDVSLLHLNSPDVDCWWTGVDGRGHSIRGERTGSCCGCWRRGLSLARVSQSGRARGLGGACGDATARRWQSGPVTRRLALLRAHGLIVKVHKTQRSQLSAQGRRVCTALLAAQATPVEKLTAVLADEASQD